MNHRMKENQHTMIKKITNYYLSNDMVKSMQIFTKKYNKVCYYLVSMGLCIMKYSQEVTQYFWLFINTQEEYISRYLEVIMFMPIQYQNKQNKKKTIYRHDLNNTKQDQYQYRIRLVSTQMHIQNKEGFYMIQ